MDSNNPNLTIAERMQLLELQAQAIQQADIIVRNGNRTEILKQYIDAEAELKDLVDNYVQNELATDPKVSFATKVAYFYPEAIENLTNSYDVDPEGFNSWQAKAYHYHNNNPLFKDISTRYLDSKKKELTEVSFLIQTVKNKMSERNESIKYYEHLQAEASKKLKELKEQQQ